MDQATLIAQLNNNLKEFPFLSKRWNEDSSQAISFIDAKKHNLTLQRLVIEGENQDFSFSEGINDLRDINAIFDLEVFYLIKLCLTGKNHLSTETKSKVNQIFLQFKLDQETYTSCITLGKKISGHLYLGSIEKFHDREKIVVAGGDHLKEFQNSFKAHFSHKLDLPFMKNASFHDSKLVTHPITFATYYSLIFLDAQRAYKIFAEEQSSFWRKRTFQIGLGLRGIPLISFFQTLLAENQFYESQAQKYKKELTIKLSHTNSDQMLGWEKRFIKLSERIIELNDLKHSFTDSFEDQFHLDIERKIDDQIKEVQSKQLHHQTKEILILQEIHNLGSDFQPKKRHKKHHHLDENDKQFALSLPEDKLSDSQSEKIENLIGDYYLNLSQSEILESELTELNTRKENELQKTQMKEEKSSQGIDKEISLLNKEINKLLSEQSNVEKTTSPLLNDLFKSDFNRERICINECINILKNHFLESHKTNLFYFFNCLKKNLAYFGSTKVLSVSFNKHYIPNIIYEKEGKLSFSNLSDVQKRNFIISFYISLFQTSLQEGGLLPSLLLFHLPSEFRNKSQSYLEKIKALFNESEMPFQILFS